MSKIILNKVKAGDLELKEKVVAINRVVKTTKGGRAFSFSALVVVGNENGVVGHGLGKAKEVQEAITKGIEDAKKNLIKVPVMKGTIPHDQLMHCLKRRIADGRVLALIRKWLKCPIVEQDGQGGSKTTAPKPGTPQGGVMTPRTQKITWHVLPS